MREALHRLMTQRVVEPLWQKQAQQAAARYSPEQRARLGELSRAVRARADAALELRDERGVAAAMSLARDASAMAITALLVARGEHSVEGVLEPPEAWARLSALIDAGELGDTPEELAVARPWLAESDVLAVDRAEPAAARKVRVATETTLEWLRSRFESRTVRQIKVSRVLRVGALVAALAVLLSTAVVHALAPTDVALHKPTTASSRRPGTPNASHAVDGDTSGSLGFHTNLQDKPWLRIDLEHRYAVSKIVVYNRGDGWYDEVLPLGVELSLDGKHYTEVAVRKTHFTAKDPWVIRLHGRSARFVRLRLKKRGYLWGSEVEVFGREE